MSLTDEENFLLSGLPTSEENTRQDERTVLLTSIEEKVKGLKIADDFVPFDERQRREVGIYNQGLAYVLAMLEAMK